MKKIIKIALVASLLTNIASANPIGRLGLDKIVRKFTIEQIKTLNQKAHGLTSSLFPNSPKKIAESLLVEVWHPAVRKGLIPSGKEFAELDNCFGQANHGILNLTVKLNPADEGCHTLLKYALELPAFSKKELAKRRRFLKALTDRGAELSMHDKFVMGPEKELKALVNLPMDASNKELKQAVLTFFTKNTEKKVWKRFDSIPEVHARLRKVARARELYPQVEKNLSAEISKNKKEELFSGII
jgi:hypothetical protein